MSCIACIHEEEGTPPRKWKKEGKKEGCWEKNFCLAAILNLAKTRRRKGNCKPKAKKKEKKEKLEEFPLLPTDI